MKIHILGVCGTFMAGIAAIARELGHEVSGSDKSIYPPMSVQLQNQNIKIFEDYNPKNLAVDTDCIIVGNAISRGNPLLEYVMTKKMHYVSAPQWLFANVLHNRHVLAVAGTHGKTTTTAMLIHLLTQAGLAPGFLVGGIPHNPDISARLGREPFFIIEADEYDSAFFDKRPKFVHYRPETLLLNNLEFDHADIYPDLAAIKLQFHYLLRTVPPNGKIISLATDKNLAAVGARGVWSEQISFGGADSIWQAELTAPDGSQFIVKYKNSVCGEIKWNFIGLHNVNNALAAIAAAVSIGIAPELAIAWMASFAGVQRRMELKGQINNIKVYDDFAHHPTAIAATLTGLRTQVGKHRIIAVVDPGSYTMRAGKHGRSLAKSLAQADVVFCRDPEMGWDVAETLKVCNKPVVIAKCIATLVNQTAQILQADDHVVVMSNTNFNSFCDLLLAKLT